jgi:hypothetical protein
MRCLLIVVAVAAGCYRPSDPACVIACTQGTANACPDGFVCGSASLCEAPNGPTCNGLFDARMDSTASDDGSVDGNLEVDAAPTPFCSQDMFLTPVAMIQAQQFTVNAQSTRMSAVGSSVYVNETAPGSSNMTDYPAVLGVPAGSIELYSGRIDPAGSTIFVTADNGTSMTASLAYVSTRMSAGVWGSYAPVLFEVNGTPAPLAIGSVFGGSTDPALGARRMPVGLATTSFDEYIEKVAGTPTLLRLERTVTAASLGVTSLRDPSFTPDGLRLVFAGEAGIMTNGIFTSTRASVASPWSPAILLVGGTSITAPYVTNDCQTLYWTTNNSGRRAAHL